MQTTDATNRITDDSEWFAEFNRYLRRGLNSSP